MSERQDSRRRGHPPSEVGGDAEPGGADPAPLSPTLPVADRIRHRALTDRRREDFTGVRRCEAAFVLLLSSQLTDWILRLREAWGALGDPGAQPAPHVTVLFLGNRTPAQLWRAAELIESVRVDPIDMTLGSFGVFGSGSIVTNLHCAVEPRAEVAAVHRTCLHALGGIGETSDSRYVRERYTPHVSIFDGISAGRRMVESLLPRVSPSRRGATTEMAIMWKVLKPSHEE
jgi:2'-5' RNA ligase